MKQTAGGEPIEIPGLGAIEPGSPEAAWLGPLLGMAVGDALGTTYEFARIEQPPYPTLATGPATDVVGKGPFNLVAGQITDDTQMAVCLARSLLGQAQRRAAAGDPRSDLDPVDLASRFIAWRRHAFDVGTQTKAAVRCLETAPANVNDAGRDVWHESGRRAAGNGSLMRTAPIGVMLAHTLSDGGALDRLVEAALRDSLLTHADPRCALACAAFDAAIAQGIAGQRGAGAAASASGAIDDARVSAMVAVARKALDLGAERMRSLWQDDRDDLAAIDDAVVTLHRDLDATQTADPGVYGSELDLQRTAGFVRVAFRLAFWHLSHTPWRPAVVDVASRGGDADTNAAIVGALVGARDGVHAIPSAWIDRVLAATQPGPADWAEAHHPRHLLAIVTHLRGAAA
jgi:ADP-ribosyl-[dinitrogen reductase] hydrolase